MGDLRLLFATDLHGSESAFRKFLNAGCALKVDALVLGGDLTGKALVPVIEDGGGYVADFNGTEQRAASEQERAELEHTIRLAGQYPFRTTPEEYAHLRANPEAVEARFRAAMCACLRSWFDLAAERLGPRGIEMVVIAGNDDPYELDEVLTGHPYVRNVDGVLAALDGVEVLGFGGSNRTPWKSPREFDEDEIERRLRASAERLSDPQSSIWNVHVPPRGTGLDSAPAVDAEFRVVRVRRAGAAHPGRQHRCQAADRRVPAWARASRPRPRVTRDRASRPVDRRQSRLGIQRGHLRAALVRRHRKKGYQVQVISG